MSKVIDEAFDSCIVGGTAWVTPDYENGQTLEMFQIDVNHAEELERKGYITILNAIKESNTRFGYIDRLQIQRLV